MLIKRIIVDDQNILHASLEFLLSIWFFVGSFECITW